MGSRQVRLRARLVDETLAGIPNKPIKFYYRLTGGTEYALIDTVNTDQLGYAEVVVTVETPKNYDFKAEFEGDTDFEPATAEVSNYKVKVKTALTVTATQV